MINFDARTAYLIVGLLYLFMPATTWIVLAGQRTQTVLIWCLGCALGGISTVLIGLRGIAPDWITLTVANLALISAMLLLIQALHQELERPFATPLLLAVGVGYMLIFEWLRLEIQLPIWRVAFVTTVQTSLLAFLTWTVWRLARDRRYQSAYWITGVFLLLLLSFIFRGGSVLLGSSSTEILHEGHSQTLDVILLPLVGILVSVITQVGYIGLVLERATRQELAAITERSHVEARQRLLGQIAHLDRQRSLGAVSHSLGEKLTEPLLSVQADARRAQQEIAKDLPDPQLTEPLLDGMIQNVRRASLTIDSIRDFIRPKTPAGETIDLGRIARDVIDLAGPEAEKQNVLIRFPLGYGPLWIKGDSIHLAHVLLNIYRNAIEALKDSPQREILVHILERNGNAILSVCDSGKEIATETLMQIGKPFFTTKPGAAGLGLSIAESIVAQHGGKLAISPAIGGGLCVDLVFPALSTTQESNP